MEECYHFLYDWGFTYDFLPCKFSSKTLGVEGKFEIYYHNVGYIVIKFDLTTNKDMMLFEGPYMIASRPTIVKEWSGGF